MGPGLPGTIWGSVGTDTRWGLGARDKSLLGVGETREKEKNGYPFTTFTDFSDFLGIIPRVLSDDLATMLISITDFYRFFGLSWET